MKQMLEQVQQSQQERLLRLKQVLELIPVAKSTWWNWVKTSKAPAPIHLGGTTCWRLSDIQALIQSAGVN